jgi:hypothetical protein
MNGRRLWPFVFSSNPFLYFVYPLIPCSPLFYDSKRFVVALLATNIVTQPTKKEKKIKEKGKKSQDPEVCWCSSGADWPSQPPPLAASQPARVSLLLDGDTSVKARVQPSV